MEIRDLEAVESKKIKKPREPKQPRKARLPKKPEKYIIRNFSIYGNALAKLESGCNVTLKEILDDIPENVSFEDVFFTVSSSDDYYGDGPDYYVNASYNLEVENEYFDLQMAEYEESISKCKLKVEEYNKKFKEYTEKLEIYKKEKKIWEIQQGEKMIKEKEKERLKLEKKIKKLKKEIEK